MRSSCKSITGLLPLLVSLLFLSLLSSCTTKASRRFEFLSETLADQNFTAVINAIKSEGLDLYGKKGTFLYYADLGVLYHYAGQYDSSNSYLEKAVTTFDELFTHSVTNEAAAVLTNDNARPYRSKPYEMLYIHMIMSMNYMSLGLPNEALVESRRSQLLIDEWSRKDKRDTKYSDDGLFQYLTAIYYNDIQEPGNASVSLIKSISAYNQIGLPPAKQIQAMAYKILKDLDRTRDIESLKLAPDSTITYDGTKPKQEEIIVVSYGGRGPVLGEAVWWGTYIDGGVMVLHHHDENGNEMTLPLPAPYVPNASGQTLTLKFAMPKVKKTNSKVKTFYVSVDGHPLVKSELVSDMDRLAERFLDDNQARNLTRTIIRVTTRTVATQLAKKAMQTDNPWANLFMNIGTDVAASQLEKADTRSLFLIPQNIYLTRIPVTPGTHSLKVQASDAKGTIITTKNFDNIVVNPRQKKFIFVPAMF